MIEHATPEHGLVPPRRLGTLLASARSARGMTLDQVSDGSGGRFSKARLASIERGTVDVADKELSALAELYDIGTSSLIPDRSHLELDVAEGVLRTQMGVEHFEPEQATPDIVLPRYLAMVYAMRQAEFGSAVPLRVEDLEVLGTALHLDSGRIEADLNALMITRDIRVGRTTSLLSRRVLIPAAGVLVAFCGVGALILSSADSAPDTAPHPIGGVTSSVGDPAVISSPATPIEPDVGSAVVQERDASGGSTPVVPRTADGPTPP
jgi:transcriptional regulator with XRE-family HTH domain